MAEKFNMTRFPFLRYLGGEFNTKMFYKNIFLLSSWDSEEENRLQSRLHRQWYSSHRGEFRKHIYIWNCECDIPHCVEAIKKVSLTIPDGYEESGVFMSSGDPGFAYLYTVKFHDAAHIIENAKEGIETDFIEVRMMCAYTRSLSRNEQHFCMSAVTLINPLKDEKNLQIAISDLSYANATDEQKAGLNKELRVHAAKIVMATVFRYGNRLDEYKMEHGETGCGDVKFPLINYTSLDMTYVNGVRLDESELDENIGERIIREADGYTLKAGGLLAYEVMHNPIDYVRAGDEQHTSTWGLKTVFNPLAESSEMYKRLYEQYRHDEPGFIGRMRMPVASGGECMISLEKVYVVRCINNGTTYFVSDSREALEPFCH